MTTALTDADVHSDERLVVAIASGDRRALAHLYDRYSGLLLAIAARIAGQGRESEDLLHDVFLEVWRCASDYDGRRGSVKTWLTLRMRSRALDRVRSARLSRWASSDEPLEHRTAPESDDPSRAVDRGRVRAALDELPREQRQVLLLGYFHGMSSSEIAEQVGISVGTVKSRVAAARRKLRALLVPAPGGAR